MKAKMRPKFTIIIWTHQDESKNETNNKQKELKFTRKLRIYQDNEILPGWHALTRMKAKMRPHSMMVDLASLESWLGWGADDVTASFRQANTLRMMWPRGHMIGPMTSGILGLI